MILKLNHVNKSFEGFKAITDVSFFIKEGDISTIIGPNGAGKTTLFNMITGKLKPNSGKIFYKDEDITGIKSYNLHKKNISISFQIVSIFQKQTALDNIKVAIMAANGKTKGLLRNAGRLFNEKSLQILEDLGLADKKDILGGMLSHGDQKLLDIGIALASDPTLLLLDEPTSGISPDETARFAELIRRIAKQKRLTILLIEHDMKVVFGISDKIMVLHHGQMIADGKPNDIRDNVKVQEVYFGREGEHS